MWVCQIPTLYTPEGMVGQHIDKIMHKCCKGKVKVTKYEEDKTNFERAYLENRWTNLAQIWYGRCTSPSEV